MRLLAFTLIVLVNTAVAQQGLNTIISALASPSKTDSTWNALVQSEKIPFTSGDSVAFLYRGEATSVKWMGDFNGWGYEKNFYNTGTRLKGTDVWVLKTSFPKDARLDYKIVIDDKDWILDPSNSFQQWSGVGGGSPNSELRMPQWKRDPAAVANPAVNRGALKRDILINSKVLGYQITYSLYVSPGAQGKITPVVYVTDGYEYLHEEMGNMAVVLDNLTAAKKITPLTAVFVDNREPANRGNNRRMQELAMNDKYLRFFIEELIPAVEKENRVSPDQRCIMGTSMGGLTAAYFAFSRPDVFGLAGIQSPAFWFRPEIYTICDNPNKQPVKTFLTTGTINDAGEGVKKMKTILEKNTCTFQYQEVAQGHSWGNWKDLIDDIMVYFFPAK